MNSRTDLPWIETEIDIWILRIPSSIAVGFVFTKVIIQFSQAAGAFDLKAASAPEATSLDVCSSSFICNGICVKFLSGYCVPKASRAEFSLRSTVETTGSASPYSSTYSARFHCLEIVDIHLCHTIILGVLWPGTWLVLVGPAILTTSVTDGKTRRVLSIVKTYAIE